MDILELSIHANYQHVGSTGDAKVRLHFPYAGEGVGDDNWDTFVVGFESPPLAPLVGLGHGRVIEAIVVSDPEVVISLDQSMIWEDHLGECALTRALRPTD